MIKTIFSFMLAFLLAFPVYAQTPGLTSPDRLRVKYDDGGVVVPRVIDNSETVVPSRPADAGPGEDVLIEKELQPKPTQLIPESIRNTVRKFVDIARPQLRSDAPEFVREKQEAYQKRVHEYQQAIKERHEEVQRRNSEHREVLQTKLKEIRNERKQRIVERIDEQLSKLNKKLTSHFLNVLEHIDKVLTNVTTRADRAVEKGLDVGNVYTAIEDAHGVIAAARDAVITQAGVVYIIEITDEETLRIDVGAARQALHTDLRGMRTLVRAAHDATRSAAVALAQIPRVDDIDKDVENEVEDESTAEDGAEAQLEE